MKLLEYIKDYFTIFGRILRRLEDLEENAKANDKMILLMYKKIGKLEADNNWETIYKK